MLDTDFGEHTFYETVWKITEGFLGCWLVDVKTMNWDLSTLLCPLVGAQTRGYPEFPNSFWKGGYRKFA
jgi:hypothetical protein